MDIYGIQKLSLLDYPDHLACTLFTGGCPFCCPFCHNKDLVLLDAHLPKLALEDIFAYLKKRKGILEGVCITGGEPLMQEDCIDFIKQIKALGYKVKLDTNGYYPTLLKQICDLKLVDYIAMDIKNSLTKYAQTCGLKNMDLNKIQESIAILKNSSIPYEFRTTIIDEYHNESDLLEIATLLEGTSPYYLQQFVNSNHVINPNLHQKTKAEMEQLRQLVIKKVPNTYLRGIE